MEAKEEIKLDPCNNNGVDDPGAIRRFHCIQTERGFAQLLSLDTFNNASNGYLVNDSCIFGAEVFIIQSSGKWGCLSMVKEPVNSTCTWKIDNFSTLTKEYYFSEVFTVREQKWKLVVYPNGDSSAKGKQLSVFLRLEDWKSFSPNQKLYSKYKLRVRDQLKSNHRELTGPVRYMRDLPPAHYTLKIESFSLLSRTQVEKYESGDFESGGYKWRLSLYPNGDKKRDGNGYISLYLAISDADAFPLGLEVFVNFRLFVFNQKQDKYLTVQDDTSCIRRFNGMKREWGFAQLLSLDTLNNASNGYLANDSCIFGAEVFVIKCSGNWECLSMVKQPVNSIYTWKIEKISTLDEESCSSNVFKVGGEQWMLLVYPKGHKSVKGQGVGVFLKLDCKSLPPNRNVYAECRLRIMDQLNGNHFERKGKHLFCASSNCWGFGNLIANSDLGQASKGFSKNDTLIVEAEIELMSVVKIVFLRMPN